MLLPQKGIVYKNRLSMTSAKAKKFAGFCGDFNPVHMSREAAAAYGFNKPVCHGAILITEISRIIGMELPGHGSLWTELQVNFTAPVLWDEQVDIAAEVVHSSPATRMVKLQFSAYVKNRKVLGGVGRVMILEKLGRRLPVLAVNERVALVTGGSRGLGFEIVKKLLQAGYEVISVSRNSNHDLETIQRSSPGLHILLADLGRSEEAVDKLRRIKPSGVNIIIHAASPVPVKHKFDNTLYREISKFNEIYIKSLIEFVVLSSANMQKLKYGRIITIGSSFILGTPPVDMTPYTVAKEALWGLTKSLAVQYGPFGITANMVSPGMMLTDMTLEVPNSVKLAEAESNPLKRLVEPDEIAGTVEFLCSEKATFINGVNMPLTGGKI